MRIFLSYRRGLTSDITGRLDDRLRQQFGKDAVFRDVDSIPPGEDFHAFLEQVIAQADILLVVIGPDWISAGDLASENDFVRIEVEAALRGELTVIPVLVGNARMPQREDLPVALQPLSKRQAVEVDSGKDFEYHVKRLIRGIESVLKRRSARSGAGETVASEEEEPGIPDMGTQRETGSGPRPHVYMGIVAALFVSVPLIWGIVVAFAPGSGERADAVPGSAGNESMSRSDAVPGDPGEANIARRVLFELDAAAINEIIGDVERVSIPVTDAQPSKGNRDALVTIVEFSDFEAAFCGKVQPTISRILNEYEGSIRLVWRNNPMPFHTKALPAHVAAMEAFRQGGSGKFWNMHDKLFENQQWLTREDFVIWSRDLGLDPNRFLAALDGNDHHVQIEEDQEIARQSGVRGVPAFYINGREIIGAQPYEIFAELIDDEIRRAQALVGYGVPRADIYAVLTRQGNTAAME